VDIKNEHIAVKEAQKLNIPTFAMVDTNSDPTQVDFPIPANDDASKSIALITKAIMEAVEKGIQERKYDKEGTEESSQDAAVPEVGIEEVAVEVAHADVSAEDSSDVVDSASDESEDSDEA
jgi:small subunit ribosomal protein S2